MVRRCKVRGCNDKHKCRGYCIHHYGVWRYQQIREEQSKYKKANYVPIPKFGTSKGKTTYVYTNGYTEQMRPLVAKIKDDVLNDCIKNPRKYLGEKEEE